MSQVDYEKGTVRLLLESKSNAVTNWIPYPSFEYEMPKIGDVVLYEPEPSSYGNPYTFGLCLGRYYNQGEIPKLSGKDIYYKAMLGDIVFIYNSTEKKLTIQTEKEINILAVEKLIIKAKNISINAETITMKGSVSITGETVINGNLAVSGIVSAANI